jgi:hypothetical protein
LVSKSDARRQWGKIDQVGYYAGDQSENHGICCGGEGSWRNVDPSGLNGQAKTSKLLLLLPATHQASRPALKGLAMFYDLNVPYSPDDPELAATLDFLAECQSFPSPPDHMRD